MRLAESSSCKDIKSTEQANVEGKPRKQNKNCPIDKEVYVGKSSAMDNVDGTGFNATDIQKLKPRFLR